MEETMSENTPGTEALEHELIDKGKVAEGYTLRYLRQIRDLQNEILKELRENCGWGESREEINL